MILTLFIHPGGTVEAVYHDEILKMGLGRAKMQRATSVEFNTRRQLWEAKLPSGRVLVEHKNRKQCLKLEHAAVEARLENKYRRKRVCR